MLSYPIWYLIHSPSTQKKKKINFKSQKQKFKLLKKKKIHDKLMTMTIKDKFKFEKMSKPNNLIQK